MKNTILILVLLSLFSCKQTTKKEPTSFFTEKISTEKLVEDINYLDSIRAQKDAGYYHYRSKSTIDSVIKDIKSKINAPKTRVEFHRLLIPYFITIGEGHNYSRFSKDYFSEYLKNVGYLFPYKVLYLKGKYYLYNKNDGDTSIPNGSELKGINNKSIQFIDAVFQNSLLRDANISASIPIGYYINSRNQFWKNYILWVSTQEDMDLSINISYTKKGSETIESIAIQRKNITPKKPSAKKTWLNFKDLKNSIAYMKVGTFYDRFEGLNYDSFIKFYEESFKNLKDNKTQNLIIDLRGNSGGRGDLPYELSKYLTKKKKIITTTKTVLKDSLDVFAIDSISKDTIYGKSIPPGYKKRNDGRFYKGEDFIENNKTENAFTGNIYLLIDEGVFSAGVWFASFFKENKIGTVIGRESRGHNGGTTAGNGEIITLKNSNFQTNVCFIRTEYSNKNQTFGRGVLPDINIEYSKEEIINGKDVILEKAIELIKSKKNR